MLVIGQRAALCLAVAFAACAPAAVVPPPVAATPSSSAVALRSDPIPSIPPNVTYAGWAVVKGIEGELITVRTTMGSPPLLMNRLLTLRGNEKDLVEGSCVLVVFRAQAEPDGTHRLVSVDLRKQPTNVDSCH